jgi:hypothetical protein
LEWNGGAWIDQPAPVFTANEHQKDKNTSRTAFSDPVCCNLLGIFFSTFGQMDFFRKL